MKTVSETILKGMDKTSSFVFNVTTKVGASLDISNFSIYKKVQDKLQACASETSLVEADYYNGSENDIENILLELKKLVNPRICPCKVGYVRDRINFLVSEGLQISNFYDVKPVSTKVDQEELEEFFKNKTTKKKTTKKKSNGRKGR